MARLRIRVELNGRNPGVPLQKMANVVEGTQRFLSLLAQDVEIEATPEDWVGSDFDADSLTFTAELTRPVTQDQARGFGEAFSGATQLRQATITQFTQIAECIEEDELIGFGLYGSDQEADPTEWRCLSRRDAIRIAEDIRMLAEVVGENGGASPLPPVQDGSVNGKRLFRERRERKALPESSKSVRDVETALVSRLNVLERQLEVYQQKVEGLDHTARSADERFDRLLDGMENFWRSAKWQQLPAPAPVVRERALWETRWLYRMMVFLLLVSLGMLGFFWYPEVQPRIDAMFGAKLFSGR